MPKKNRKQKSHVIERQNLIYTENSFINWSSLLYMKWFVLTSASDRWHKESGFRLALVCGPVAFRVSLAEVNLSFTGVLGSCFIFFPPVLVAVAAFLFGAMLYSCPRTATTGIYSFILRKLIHKTVQKTNCVFSFLFCQIYCQYNFTSSKLRSHLALTCVLGDLVTQGHLKLQV